jgi:tetratricopeptide (TPR) repeat protein
MKHLILVGGLLVVSLSSQGQSKKANEYFWKGYKMVDARNYKSAVAFFVKAIDADSTGDCGTQTKGKAHGELGYAYLKIGDTLNAYKYFDKSISLDATNPFPVQNKAVLLSMQNKNGEAYVLLDKLIQVKPDFIDAYVQRGFLYNADNKSELAIADFKTALKLNSKAKLLSPELIRDINAILKSNKKR